MKKILKKRKYLKPSVVSENRINDVALGCSLGGRGEKTSGEGCGSPVGLS